MTYESIQAWRAEAMRRFGKDPLMWRFVCPACGYVCNAKEWIRLGGVNARAMVAFSCVGRLTENPVEMGQKPGPCNYAGGGLICLNPVEIVGEAEKVFDFAAEATP